MLAFLEEMSWLLVRALCTASDSAVPVWKLVPICHYDHPAVERFGRQRYGMIVYLSCYAR